MLDRLSNHLATHCWQLPEEVRLAFARLVCALDDGCEPDINAALWALGVVTPRDDEALRSQMAYGMFDTRGRWPFSALLCELIGKPLKQSAKLFGEPIKQPAKLVGDPIMQSANLVRGPIKGRVVLGRDPLSAIPWTRSRVPALCFAT